MPHLKNRENHIPGGFRFIQPQTNWRAPEWQSFTSTVYAVISHRKGNPPLITQYGLSVDFEAVSAEVDSYNAAIAKANGWTEFYADDDAPVPFPSRPYQPVVGVAEHLRRAVVGVGVMKDWLGEGMVPVDRTRAENRAIICADCPQNADPDWLQKAEEGIARITKDLIEAKNKMQLVTGQDSKLHTCQACDCYLRLKIWVPPDVVQAKTSDKLRSELRQKKPDCWVLAEAK